MNAAVPLANATRAAGDEPDATARSAGRSAERSAQREARRRRLETVTIPALRLLGFFIIALFIELNNTLVGGGLGPTASRAVAVGFVIYGALSWVALRALYGRTGRLDLGLFFLTLDIPL